MYVAMTWMQRLEHKEKWTAKPLLEQFMISTHLTECLLEELRLADIRCIVSRKKTRWSNGQNVQGQRRDSWTHIKWMLQTGKSYIMWPCDLDICVDLFTPKLGHVTRTPCWRYVLTGRWIPLNIGVIFFSLINHTSFMPVCYTTFH